VASNEASKSSRTIPVDAAVALAPMRSASRRITGIPAAAIEYAQAHPVKPPPITTTVVSELPRHLGNDGRRVFGSVSSQKGEYLIMNS
jgi:hypothetical protein